MKKQLIFLILLGAGLVVNAQEYRLAKSSGQLKINLSGVIVEGYDGKEIIFSGQKVVADEPTDERAKGLVPISSSKYADNTGIGINVSENGQDVNVNLVSKKPIGQLTIKVPQNIKVSILNNNNGMFAFSVTNSININNALNDTKSLDKVSDEIVLRNLKNEIEVSVNNAKIRLENNTGPMNIKTVSGSVDAIFNSEIKGPISIISVMNYVDVTLPSSTKANIEMGTNQGKLFAGKEFKFDLDKVIETEILPSVITTTGARAANRQVYTTQGDNVIMITGNNVAPSSAAKTKTTGSGKNKNEEVVVTGYARGEVAATTVPANVNQSINKIVEGVKVENTKTLIDGVEVKPVEGRIYSAPSFRTDGHTLLTRGYYSSGDRIKGKLNGGGIDLIFKSTNKNVYLREK